MREFFFCRTICNAKRSSYTTKMWIKFENINLVDAMDVIVTMCVQFMVYASWENEVVKNLFVVKLLLAEAPPEVLCKKEKIANFTGKHLCWRLFNKKRFQRKCFPVKFGKVLKTPILKNICGRLLLYCLFFS